MPTMAQAAFATLRHSLVVTLLGEVESKGWGTLQRDLLERVAHSRAHGVILDVSAVRVLDAQDAEALRRTVMMCGLLGARCIVAGLSMSLVASLTELDLTLTEVETASSVETALDRIAPKARHAV